MEMLSTAAKLHWIFLVRIGCALCVFSITRAKMKSVQRQQQPAKESSISNAVIGSKRGPHTWNRHLFFFLPLSCWLATYKFSSRFNWYKKFGHNGMQWALKMWTNFSKEKVSVAVKGVGWLWYQKSNENCVPRQDNVPSLLFEEKQFFSILGRIECNPIWMLKSSNFPQWFQRFDFTMYSS